MASILAVDDSDETRLMVRFALQHAGFSVVEAVDGVDACEKAALQDFDLVITDQNMPRMDGLGLTRTLRADPRFDRLPILFLTSEDSDQFKQASHSAGANGCMVKPFDAPTLFAAVAQALRPRESSTFD